MKSIKIFALIVLTVSLCTMTSCSSNDEEVANKKLENMEFRSVESNSHNTTSVLQDKVDNNTFAQTRIQMMGGLKYTVDEITESKDVAVDLCKKSEHSEDALMSLSFVSGKCKIKCSTFQSVMKAKRNETKKVYRFNEGHYTVSTGSHSYESIDVYNYGIYRADGTVFIPFDGDGYVTVQTTTTFENKRTENENVNEKTILADYKISNDKITFSFTENSQIRTFEGTLTDDGQSITIYENPFVPTILTFKR